MPLEVCAAEIVSNLAWLIFVAASFLLWRRWVRPQLGGRCRRSLCALLAVLLMMFPIISISDDLHPDSVAAVEGESKVRLMPLAHSLRASTAPALHLAPPAQLSTYRATEPETGSTGLIVRPAHAGGARAEARTSGYRGPPTNLLT